MSDASSTEQPLTARPKMRGRTKFLLIISSLILMGLLRTGFVFFVIGMLPCIVAYYMDISKQRYTFKSVFSANLAGMLPYLGKMLEHGPQSGALHQIMGSASTWITIYGAAFLGWLLVQMCPVFAQSIVRNYHESKIAQFERMQRKIEGEWGPEVTQFSKVPESDES